MKALAYFSACFAALAAATSAQLPAAATAAPAEHHLFLNVQTMVSGGASTGGRPPTGAGTSSKNTNHSTTLQVAIRNVGAAPDQVKVEWYFFGKAVNAKEDSTLDSGSKEVTIEAGKEEKFAVTSKDIVSSVVTTRTATKRQVTVNNTTQTVTEYNESSSRAGNKLTGWLVRLVADGKVIYVRGSDPKYEEAGKGLGQLPHLK